MSQVRETRSLLGQNNNGSEQDYQQHNSNTITINKSSDRYDSDNDDENNSDDESTTAIKMVRILSTLPIALFIFILFVTTIAQQIIEHDFDITIPSLTTYSSLIEINIDNVPAIYGSEFDFTLKLSGASVQSSFSCPNVDHEVHHITLITHGSDSDGPYHQRVGEWIQLDEVMNQLTTIVTFPEQINISHYAITVEITTNHIPKDFILTELKLTTRQRQRQEQPITLIPSGRTQLQFTPSPSITSFPPTMSYHQHITESKNETLHHRSRSFALNLTSTLVDLSSTQLTLSTNATLLQIESTPIFFVDPFYTTHGHNHPPCQFTVEPNKRTLQPQWQQRHQKQKSTVLMEKSTTTTRTPPTTVAATAQQQLGKSIKWIPISPQPDAYHQQLIFDFTNTTIIPIDSNIRIKCPGWVIFPQLKTTLDNHISFTLHNKQQQPPSLTPTEVNFESFPTLESRYRLQRSSKYPKEWNKITPSMLLFEDNDIKTDLTSTQTLTTEQTNAFVISSWLMTPISLHPNNVDDADVERLIKFTRVSAFVGLICLALVIGVVIFGIRVGLPYFRNYKHNKANQGKIEDFQQQHEFASARELLSADEYQFIQ
jgi:hypothetical protein